MLAGFLGMVSFVPVAEASWFHVPTPFYFGVPHFEWSSNVTMILISLVSMVESTGVFFALGDVVERKIESEDLKKGYRAEGLAVLLGGIFNTFPYTTFSQNVYHIAEGRTVPDWWRKIIVKFLPVHFPIQK